MSVILFRPHSDVDDVESVLLVNPIMWSCRTDTPHPEPSGTWKYDRWLDKMCLVITAHPRFSILGTVLHLTQTARTFDLTSERQGWCFTPFGELPKMGFREAVNSWMCYPWWPISRVTLYTAGHLHTAVPHCSHNRAPIVHTAVPRENNEHGCVYLRCRAVCKLPGCVEGHPWICSDFFCHDDVIKWKHFPRYWPFVRGIHRSPVNSPHKGQWRGDLVFSLICARINDRVNNGGAGDLRRYRAHYDVIVMS